MVYSSNQTRMAYVKKIFLVIIGLSLVIVGVLGVVLPIVHGTFFLLLGVVLLSLESRYIEERLLKVVEKNKTLHHWHKKMDIWLRKFFKK